MADQDIVFLAWNDFVGLTRTRGVPERELSRRMKHGLGWAVAGQALTPFEDIAPNPWGPMEEVRQTPDPTTEVRLDLWSDAPALHFMLCDSLNPDGSPWECCTRSFLRGAVAALDEATGLRPMIAYEHEFILLAEGFTPATPFTLEAARIAAPVLGRLAEALTRARVGLETVEPEFGVGQYEVSCGPAPGVSAGDRCIITREVVREVARREGYRATFTPALSPSGAGNGAHLHLSLWDKENRPAAWDPDAPGELSETAAHFAAGILRHLPALTAFTAPSPVSYLRLIPHHWSCAFNAFGVQNREAALRVVPSPEHAREKRGEAFNIEYRPIDGAANPYLAIGAIVRAGLEGIRHTLPAPPLLDRDPADLTEGERAKLGIEMLPRSLSEALDALEADETVRGWFAPNALETYVNVKRTEVEMFKDVEPAAICEKYAHAY